MAAGERDDGRPSGGKGVDSAGIEEARRIACRAAPDAVRALVNVVKAPTRSDQTRVTAIKTLLDFATRQPVVSEPDSKPVDWTPERARAALARIEAEDDGDAVH